MNHPQEMNCPLSKIKAGQLVDALSMQPNGKVIDIGCGSGVFLLDVAQRYDASGRGVDNDQAALLAAKKLAHDRGVAECVTFDRVDIRSAEIGDNTFDVGICIGATHAFASGEPAYPKALAGMSRIIRDGGLLLLGEGYWKQRPAKEYVDFIGEPVGCYRSHQENVAVGESMGLIPLLAMTANEDEWDEFEWRHHRRVLAETKDLREEANRKRRERCIAWRNAYLKWGRQTMGFGYYLFRNGVLNM